MMTIFRASNIPSACPPVSTLSERGDYAQCVYLLSSSTLYKISIQQIFMQGVLDFCWRQFKRATNTSPWDLG